MLIYVLFYHGDIAPGPSEDKVTPETGLGKWETSDVPDCPLEAEAEIDPSK